MIKFKANQSKKVKATYDFITEEIKNIEHIRQPLSSPFRKISEISETETKLSQSYVKELERDILENEEDENLSILDHWIDIF